MMAGSSQKALILALPNELLANIAASLDKPSLTNLHATCRDIFTSLDEIYLERFFATRKHVYTLRGLQTLLDITSNTRLVGRVRKIVLVAYELRLFERPGYKNRFLWLEEDHDPGKCGLTNNFMKACENITLTWSN